jgi:hypothetical protein
MLDPKFKQLSVTLTGKLNMLWVLVYRATNEGLSDQELEMFKRVLHDVNVLHAEMFPGFEHALYGDDLLSLVEGEGEGEHEGE